MLLPPRLVDGQMSRNLHGGTATLSSKYINTNSLFAVNMRAVPAVARMYFRMAGYSRLRKPILLRIVLEIQDGWDLRYFCTCQNFFYKCNVYSRPILEMESLALFLRRSPSLVLCIRCLTISYHSFPFTGAYTSSRAYPDFVFVCTYIWGERCSPHASTFPGLPPLFFLLCYYCSHKFFQTSQNPMQ